MRTLIAMILCTTVTAFAQYPFEQFPAIPTTNYTVWKVNDQLETSNTISSTMTIPGFFASDDSLTIRLSSGGENSTIKLYKNSTQLNTSKEVVHFYQGAVDTVRVADFNSDGLKDVKLTCSYMGCGLAAWNVRVIYLFQKEHGSFTKIAFDDNIISPHPERDMNGDGIGEIFTMELQGHGRHNFWTYNIYNYTNGKLINVNDIADYPIMIQYLNRDNFDITDKLSRRQMKRYARKVPEGYKFD